MEDRRLKKEHRRLGMVEGGWWVLVLKLCVLAVLLHPNFASAQTIQFLNAAPSVYENGTNVSVVVTRTPATGIAAVQYTTLDGTAVAGSDYQLTSGALTFNDGESFQIITIPIINDSVPEGTETLLVVLSNPSGGTLGLSTNIVTIFDDDTILRLGNSSYSVSEDGTNLVVEVLRNGGTAGTVSVDYLTQTPPGTNTALFATPNVDYTASYGTLVFVDGQITNYITIPITDDCLVETNEMFQVVLTNAIGATIGTPNLADITILDDDSPGAGSFVFSSVTPLGTNITESVGTITVHVSRLCGTAGAVSVNYAAAFAFAGVCPGSDLALTNQDYILGGSGTLNWAAGDGTDKTFDITIINDGLLELDETIVLLLSNPTGGARVKPSGARLGITIFFDEQPPGAADQTHNVQTPVNPTPGANNRVYASAVYTDTNDLANFNKSLIGGDFSGVNAVVRNGIARLNPDGSVDTVFNPGSGADGSINAVVIQPFTGGSSRILVAGGFTSINNVSRNGIARLNANGTLDGSFNPGSGANGQVLAMALQTDGKVIITGEFTSVNNLPRNRIARLNANGSVDNSFNPPGGADDTVYAVAVQPDGSIVLGGLFQSVNGTAQSAIARLLPNGSIDGTFNPLSGADNAIFALALQNNGGILIGGAFSTYDGVSRTSVARVNPDGTLDSSFGPCSGAVGPVYALKIQSDGKIVIGGEFTSYNGTPRLNIARLYRDGTVDTGFLDSYYNQTQPGPDQFVSTIALQTDGNIIIGGGFAAIGGGPTASAVLTRYNVARLIGDDPQPAFNLAGNVQFFSPTYSVDEYAGALTVTVTRSNGILGTVAVDYATADDTAVAGVHYGAVSGSLVWADCDTVPRTFSVPIINNSIVDGNHNFKLFLSNPHSVGTNLVAQPALGFQCSAVVTILDEDVNYGALGFGSPIYNVNEDGGSATITVTRTNGTSGEVQVQFATSNGSAAAPSDYTATNGTLRFFSGDTSKTFSVRINNDLAKEPEETVNLRLFGASGGATLGRTNATLLIFDNDNGEGSVSFAAQNFNVTEGTGANTTNYATVTVRRTSGSSGTVAVDAYTVQLPLGPGIAREGIDYIGVTNHLTFGPGVTNLSFTIPILSDRLVEGDELIGLTVANVFNGTIGFLTNATVTIADDDSYGNLTFSNPTFYFSEKATNALVRVTRLGGNAEEVSVDYFTTAGTATDGMDYMGVSNTLVFADGQVTNTITIPLLDDTALEFNEILFLTLTNFSKAGAGPFTNATVVISDDEELNVPAGSVDTLFNPNPGADGFVNALAVQTNGTIVIGGAFSSITGVGRNRIARLLPDGTLDGTFNPRSGANGAIRAMALQPDQKVIVAGDFTAIATTNRNYVGRLNQNGGVDTTFNPGAGADNPIYAVALQNDGKILIGGNFTSFNGVSRNGIARLNANGTLDGSFRLSTGVNGTVRGIAVQNDGKILIAGNFVLVNGESSPGVARLNADGSFDSSFFVDVGADGEVHAVALQSDGAVLIGGVFNNFNGVGRNYLARLNTDGSLDFSFNPAAGPDNSVSAITVQSDGKILIVGEFTSFNGITARRIARLSPDDGSIDPTINFGTGADGGINAIALQSNEEMVIGGSFTSFNAIPRQYVARLVGGINLGAGSLQFSSQAYRINEDQTNATITIFRTGGLAGRVTVMYATSNGNADAGLDYTNVTDTMVFREGETRGSFDIPIINDTAVELDETVILTLSTPTGGAELTPPPTAVLTIVSDDCILGFSSSAYSVNENVVGSNAVINVVRTGGTIGTVFVDYATAPGLATPGVDYQTNRGTIFFGPGETNKTFTIGIFDDLLQEGNEDFRVTLSRPRGSAILGLATATVTIVDNDLSPGVFAFFSPSYSVSEDASNAFIFVVRTNGSQGVVSVQYSTIAGTATAGTDYTTKSGTLTFAQGESIKVIIVPILDDAIVERDETFFISLANPSGGAVIAGPTSVTVTIIDNEFRPGSVDLDFDTGPGANGFVRSLALGPDGKILAGGGFTVFNNTNRHYIARLNPDGSLDYSFDPGVGADAAISSVACMADGRAVLGGTFTNINGLSYKYVGRLLTNGLPDVNFVQRAGFNAAVNAVAVTASGRTVVGGGFSLPTHNIIQLLAGGAIDASFNPGTGADGPIHYVLTQSDGKVLIGGAFTSLNGAARSRVARLSANGAIDVDFAPAGITNGTVYCLLRQPDGRLLVGGDFYITGRTNPVGITRLNLDGSLDATFDAGRGANGAVFAFGLQPQGKIIVAGNFTTINTTNRNRYARLNPNGSLDLSFDPDTGANNTVYSVLMLPDSNFLIAGEFSMVGGFPRNKIARIKADDGNFKFLSAPRGNPLQMLLVSKPGGVYILDASSDLINWSPVGTNIAIGSTLLLTDPDPNPGVKRFYRAWKP